MKFSKQLSIAALALAGIAGSAQATTLSWNINADNAFTAYLSTNDSSAGNQIDSGNDWRTTDSGSDSSLQANQNYFLHILATNELNVAGILGDFSLSGSDHVFGNNTKGTTTNAADWASGAGWGNYSDTTTSLGVNGTAPWGSVTGVNNTAEWIWGATTGNNQDLYFSLAITSADSSPVPVPSAVWLFGSGLVGFIGMRKKASKIA